MSRYVVLFLILTRVPIPFLDAQVDRSYVELLELMNPTPYSSSELEVLRASLERERDDGIESCRRLEKDWKSQIATARSDLRKINKSSSRDTGDMADRRESLHAQIATLERDIGEKTAERERVIPAAFEIQLAKLQLAKRWPDRREKVAADIADGHARDRKHGDVEDIGYRQIVKDPEKDIEVGEKAIRQLMSEGRLPMEIEDPAVHQYVRSLAARIVESSDLKVPLHLTILDSADIHPITLPGGYLFLSSGLIKTTRSEAELAGVISREIARIAARQETRSSKGALISKIFTPVAQMAAGVLTAGTASPGVHYGIGYGVQGMGALVDRTLVGSGGKYQKEADQLGIQYAWKAGFDPRGFIAFLDSISADSEVAGVLTSSTPRELGERLVAAFGEIEYLPPRETYSSDSAEFRRAKARLQRN